MVVVCQRQYPELAETIVLYKPPFGLKAVFNFVKMFMSQETVRKIKWMYKPEELLTIIDKSVLMKQYGGTHNVYPNFAGKLL